MWIKIARLICKYISKIYIFCIFGMIFSGILGIYFGFHAPYDYQQNLMIKMLYLHVPLAIFSTIIYSIIGILSITSIWHANKIAYLSAISLIKLNICFVALTIFTGSIWGKVIWGTFWAWDTRLTSMLVLLLFLIAQYLVINSKKNKLAVKEIFCILSIIGLVNLPIIKFSVYFWNNLHQKSSFLNLNGPTITKEIAFPLIYSFGFLIFYTLLIFSMEFCINFQITKKFLKNSQYSKI